MSPSNHDTQPGSNGVVGVEQSADAPGRRAWEAPVLSKLPRLTELTLQTGGAIGGRGGTGGGGTTVF